MTHPAAPVIRRLSDALWRDRELIATHVRASARRERLVRP